MMNGILRKSINTPANPSRHKHPSRKMALSDPQGFAAGAGEQILGIPQKALVLPEGAFYVVDTGLNQEIARPLLRKKACPLEGVPNLVELLVHSQRVAELGPGPRLEIGDPASAVECGIELFGRGPRLAGEAQHLPGIAVPGLEADREKDLDAGPAVRAGIALFPGQLVPPPGPHERQVLVSLLPLLPPELLRALDGLPRAVDAGVVDGVLLGRGTECLGGALRAAGYQMADLANPSAPAGPRRRITEQDFEIALPEMAHSSLHEKTPAWKAC